MQSRVKRRAARLPGAISAALYPIRQDSAVPGWLNCAFAFGLAVGGCASADAAGFLVSNNGDPGTGGLSLRQAITAASAESGNIVYFDPALNGSTITLTQGGIAITNSTTVLGPGADKLTISGGGNSRIFTLDAAAQVTISGLTLTAGSAPVGSAIYVSHAALLILQDSVIAGNTTAKFYSAAIDLKVAGASQITGCTIANNIGGGIYAAYSTPVIANTRISGNSKTGDGAGIVAFGSTLSVSNSTISGNSASGDGGGILINSNFGSSASLSLIQSSVSANSGYYFGAGIDVKRATSVYISQSLISGNTLTSFTGTGYGGGGLALRIVSGPTKIVNSTFYGNFAYHNGGAIGIFDATTGDGVSIGYSTISGNSTAYFYSNGIQGAGEPHIFSSIVANNSSKLYTQDMVGTFRVRYSLVKNTNGTTITGNGNIFGVDPQLGPLAINGGPTLTMLPAVTSPVLDAGPAPPIEQTTDQRGVPRIVGSSADMGAIERQVPEVIIFRNGFDSS